MAMKRTFKLTESEILQLANILLTEQRPGVIRRAWAIQLLAIGEERTAVARRMGVHPETIRVWVQSFRRHGYAGLAEQPRKRKKRKADQAYCQALEESIRHGPAKYGYASAGWTVELLRDHLETRTGTHLSCSRLRMVLRSQGFSTRQLKNGYPKEKATKS